MKAYIARIRRSAVALGLVLAGLGAATAAQAQQPRHITLEEAIQIALQQSSEVARAENQTTLAALSVSEARSRFLPDLSLSASTSQSYGTTVGAVDGTLPNASINATNLRLGSSVTLFDGFGNVANLRGAQLGAQATELSAERTRQTVVVGVLSGYLGLTEAEEQLRVAQENLAAQQQREEQVCVLVDAGSRPIAELYQQQAQVAAARAALVGAQRAVELARMELVQVMQLDPSGEYVFEAPALPEPSPAAELDVDALVARALEMRPDLRALATGVAGAEQGVRAASSNWWPTVSLSAGYGSNLSSANQQLAWLEQLDQRQGGSLSLSVSVPLFDRQATSRAIQRANVEVSNAQLALADARQQIAVEVKRAVLDRAASAASLEAAQARVAAAQQALTATERRYEAGLATLFEVTQTRADLVDATSAAVRARYTMLFQDAVLDYYTGTLAAE